MATNLLLHTCCAPCLSGVLFQLQPAYRVTAFYYNPNIAEISEYQSRFDELLRYADMEGFPVVEGQKDSRRWFDLIRDYRHLGEKSSRCDLCYRMRLEMTFRYASTHGYDAVATVLSVSPHKKVDVINTIGRELSLAYGIDFLERDFKKNNGFKISVENSRRYSFYRQNYCGCVYSQKERDKTSLWGKNEKLTNGICLNN